MLEGLKQTVNIIDQAMHVHEGKTISEMEKVVFQPYEVLTKEEAEHELKTFYNDLDVDLTITRDNGKKGAFQLLKPDFNVKPHDLDEDPNHAVDLINRLRVRNVFWDFLNVNPDYSLESKIDKKLLREFDTYNEYVKRGLAQEYYDNKQDTDDDGLPF